jgi:soluble lytic murein transglycosylase-like protein
MATITQILSDAASAAGVPFEILYAQAQQESGLNPNAYNAASGATGLLQLEPATAAQLGVTNPLDAQQNANGGATYLAQLYDQFGDWSAALAAYDWGPGNVSAAIAQWGDDFLSHAPAETQNYVASILSAAGMDYTPQLTPASVANGVVQTASSALDTAAGPSPIGKVLLLTGFGLFAYLLATELL